MPYADKEKQKAYMRDWSRNFQRRKTARLKELEARFQKQTQEQTSQTEDAFKPKPPPDPRDERIAELEQTIAEKNGQITDLLIEFMYQRVKLKESEILVRQKHHE